MKTHSSPIPTVLGSLLLAILAAWLALAILNGKGIPFISEDRAAFIAFLVVGIALCGLGIGRVSATGQWLHPLAIISYILGGLALLVAAAGLFGVALPAIHSTRDVMMALAGIMIAKFVVSLIHMLVWK